MGMVIFVLMALWTFVGVGRHEVEPGGVHVFQAFASFLPECQPAIGWIGAFIRHRAVRA